MGFLLLRRVCSGLVSGGNASQAFHCGPRLGELSGGNWNGRSQQHVLYCAFAVGDWGCFFGDPLLWYNSGRFGGLPAALFLQRSRRTIVTWLILPVVICLSQRLSHACLSISNYTVKLRMAH